MRTLHVAAMPFPTQQGTQGLVHAVATALTDAGDDVHLVCYPHGAFERDASYPVHRVRARVRQRSFRSGPSLEKLALDAALARALPRLVRELSPDIIVAHHVEAAACALLTARAPLVYVAHTSLEAELPSYLSSALERPVRAAGRMVEAQLCRRADLALAVSPRLASMLCDASGVEVQAVPLPWPVQRAASADERARARRELDLPGDELVFLYAGNLDRYQGLGTLVSGLAQAARAGLSFTWLVATASRPEELAPELHRLAPHVRVRFTRLDDEAARARSHAASDAALVPRGSPGGIPIKLLDALARGVPVLAAQRASADLPLAEACTLVADDDPCAWAEALARFAAAPAAARHALGVRGRTYIERAHEPLASARAVRALLEPLTHRARG